MPNQQIESPIGQLNKKTIKSILIAVAVLILGVVGYLGFNYWQKGTPKYSINQLRMAFQNKDATSAQRYVDIDSIFNNYWPRIKAKVSQVYNNNPIASLIMAGLENRKSESQDDFKNTFYENTRGKGEGLLLGIMTQIFAIKKPIFVINGDTAILKIDYHHKSYNKNYGLDIILSRQADKTWKIIDIQGLEDIMVTALSMVPRDNTRISSLSQFRAGVELYFDDNKEYPNSLNLLYPKYLIKISVDPLDNTPYKYAYSISSGKILHYHLGISLEDPTNTVLNSDADCNSNTNPPVNCPGTGIYIHGFNGGDTLGCNGEVGRVCYDIAN